MKLFEINAKTLLLFSHIQLKIIKFLNLAQFTTNYLANIFKKIIIFIKWVYQENQLYPGIQL